MREMITIIYANRRVLSRRGRVEHHIVRSRSMTIIRDDDVNRLIYCLLIPSRAAIIHRHRDGNVWCLRNTRTLVTHRVPFKNGISSAKKGQQHGHLS